MLNLKTNSQIQNRPNFTSRSKLIKNADDICRLVIKEFPNTYSNTKLYNYHSIEKSPRLKNYRYYVSSLVDNARKYYNEPESISLKFAREIAVLKKQQIGNCAEMADATYMALKLNGYKDVKVINLYAYNPKTNKMRDLKHTTVGINFKLPKDYEYCKYAGFNCEISPKYRIYPQNDSIIVDSWAGFTEYGKNIKERYNTRYDMIKLLKTPNQPVKESETLLQEGEQFCFVPIYEQEFIKPDRLASYGKEYYGVIHPKNKGNIDTTSDRILPDYSGLSEKTILRLKGKYNLKGAPTQEELQKLNDEYMQAVYERWGIRPNNEKKDNKNMFLKKICSFFKK